MELHCARLEYAVQEATRITKTFAQLLKPSTVARQKSQFNTKPRRVVLKDSPHGSAALSK